MNIYKIWQDINTSWDAYESAVVFAERTEQARLLNPNFDSDDKKLLDGKDPDNYWCNVEDVKVELIGKATGKREVGIIVASFRAG